MSIRDGINYMGRTLAGALPRRRRGKSLPEDQGLMFGLTPADLLRVSEPAEPVLLPLEWEGHAVRVIKIDGEPWWVAKDVCAVLGLEDVSKAVLGNTASGNLGLDDDERRQMLDTNNHLANDIRRGSWLISESGLYALIFKSRKPEARRFRKWVTSEVLPSIRKTGKYEFPNGDVEKIERVRRRNKCDVETAALRVKSETFNKKHRNPAKYAGAYLGLFGATAPELRAVVGFSSHRSPMDAMDIVALSASVLALATANERVALNGLPRGGCTDLYADIATSVKDTVLGKVGAARFGLRDDPERGPVIGIVALPAPEKAS